MADFGIRISKPGKDATNTLTEATKKNFVALDLEESHKVYFKGFVTSGTYTHSLGRLPFVLCFLVDSATTPTLYTASDAIRITDTQVTSVPNPGYLIVMLEGE